jgi:lipopolysaccharide transport system ATP-binding protein
MNEPLVKVENLSKKFCRNLKRSLWYGIKDIGAELTACSKKKVKLRKEEFWALDDVGFEIRKGELVGLIGANGAGKTTILKLLTGLIKPDKGVITIRGKIQALIALGAGFNPILTGRENIYINGAILGFSKKEIDVLIDEITDFAEIGEFIDMPVQSYSSGMHVRLGFAVAVNLKPDILIVDEVLAVGDASFRRKARNKMMELLHSGISVLFVSHNMATVNAITSRCIYIKKGKIVAVGPSEEVTSLYLRDSISKSQKKQDVEDNNYMDSAYLSLPDVLVLKKVRLTDASGKETAEFHTHENIRLTFEMEFKETLKNVAFAFGIRTSIDDVVVGGSRIIPGNDAYKGSVTVTCEIVRNTLREGVYNMAFYVAGADGGSLFKSNNVKTMTILADMGTIEGSGSSQGLVVLDTSWKVL